MKNIFEAEWPEWLPNLIDAARLAQANAYAPYSSYMVGVAILDTNGKIFSSCNVENAAYTGSHAETGAIAQMVVKGSKNIQAVVCVTKDGGSPCGDCRQRIWEFCNNNPTVPIFLRGDDKVVQQTTIGELLRHAFELD